MIDKPVKLPRPPRKEQNSSNTLLIMIIVVLVAILSMAAGYMFYGNVKHSQITNNTTLNNTNETNTIANNATPTNPSTQENTENNNGNSVNNGGSSGYSISENQALQIVEANAGNHPYIYGGTQSINGQTYYLFQYQEGENYNGDAMWNSYEVNVETGAMS